jgi:phage-related protein
MANPSLFQIEEKNKLTSNIPWLIAIKVHVVHPVSGQVVDHIRLVRNDNPVTIDGEVYEPFIFDIDIKKKLNELPSLTITAQDHRGLIASRLHGFKGGVGSKVDLMIFAADGEDVLSDPELTEYFEILKASVDDYVATWSLGTENPLRITFPRRKQYRDRCPWLYKDENCTYSGDLPTCDFTLDGENGCRAHGNSINFGGMPGLRG